MTALYDFRKLRRLLVIQTVVQIILLALLISIAIPFQQKLGSAFSTSLLIALGIQLLNFYPLKKLTALEVDREIASARTGLTPAELQALRRKRVTADVIKTSIFVFFLIFIMQLPEQSFILATVYFIFVFTCIAYFQCFNFAARREMRLRSGQ